jgi:hypothetical protein
LQVFVSDPSTSPITQEDLATKRKERSLNVNSAPPVCRAIPIEPVYRKGIFHLTVSGVNECQDLEEELLAFPKSPNDDKAIVQRIRLKLRSLRAGVLRLIWPRRGADLRSISRAE